MPLNFNFQPIYQRYVGDNNDLLDKQLTKKEEEYKVGEEYMSAYEKLQKGMRAAEPLTADVEAVNQLRIEALNHIKNFAQQGDYENLYNKIKSSVTDIAGRYNNYAENLKSFQESLQERMKADDGKWGKDASWYRQMQIEEYNRKGGLKIDPATGQATGFFKFESMPEYLNVPEDVQKFLKEKHINKNSTESGLYNTTQGGNEFFANTNVETRQRDYNELSAAGKRYILDNPHAKSVLEIQSKIQAYKLAKNPEALLNLKQSLDNNYNESINYLNKQIDKIKNNKNLSDSVKEVEIGKLNTQIESFKSNAIKIDNEDLTNFDSLTNKLFQYNLNDVTSLAASNLAVNEKDVKTNFYHSDVKSHAAITAADLAKANSTNIVIDAGSRELSPETVGKEFGNLLTNYKTIKDSYNTLVKQFGYSKTPKLDNLIFEINSLQMNGGLSEEKMNKIAEIANTKYGWRITNDNKNEVVNKLLTLAKTKTDADKVKNDLQDYSNVVASTIKDTDAVGAYLSAYGELPYNEESRENSPDVKEFKINGKIYYLNKDELDEVKKVVLMNYSVGNNPTLLGNTLTHFKDMILASFEGLPLDNVKAMNTVMAKTNIAEANRKINNYFKDNNIKLQNYRENQEVITNSDEKSSIGSLNKGITNALNNVNIFALKYINGKTIQEAFNDKDITDEKGEVVESLGNFKTSAIGNGFISLKFEKAIVDGEEKEVSIKIPLSQQGNITEQSKKNLSTAYSQEKDGKTKEKIANIYSNTLFNETQNTILANLFNPRNIDNINQPVTFNLEGSNIVLKVTPIKNGAVMVNAITDKGLIGVPVINNDKKVEYNTLYRNINDLKHDVALWQISLDYKNNFNN